LIWDPLLKTVVTLMLIGSRVKPGEEQKERQRELECSHPGLDPGSMLQQAQFALLTLR